jgi:hypothetical protein
MTVSNVSPLTRLAIGIVLTVVGLLLLRFMPAIHERYFGQYRLSGLQRVGGPVFVIAIGSLLVVGGVFGLS